MTNGEDTPETGEELLCPCGCGKTRAAAVRETARAMSLNADQADALIPDPWLFSQELRCELWPVCANLDLCVRPRCLG
jgi:hypothetical protein